MIFTYDFGIRSVPPCNDCDTDGHCTMNCGPVRDKASFKGNPAMRELRRGERRNLLIAERRARMTGDWGAWETVDLPHGVLGTTGWPRQVTSVRKNRVFSVLVRPCDGATHLAVSSLSGVRPTWHEMQRLKNELAGAEAMAVEIYPPAADVVDGADMFHLFVLDHPLPFNLATDAPPPKAARPSGRPQPLARSAKRGGGLDPK